MDQKSLATPRMALEAREIFPVPAFVTYFTKLGRKAFHCTLLHHLPK